MTIDKFIIWLCRAIGCAGGILAIEGIFVINVGLVLLGTLTAIGFAFLSVTYEKEFMGK